jgi:hypothetical protein
MAWNFDSFKRSSLMKMKVANLKSFIQKRRTRIGVPLQCIVTEEVPFVNLGSQSNGRRCQVFMRCCWIKKSFTLGNASMLLKDSMMVMDIFLRETVTVMVSRLTAKSIK